MTRMAVAMGHGGEWRRMPHWGLGAWGTGGERDGGAWGDDLVERGSGDHEGHFWLGREGEGDEDEGVVQGARGVGGEVLEGGRGCGAGCVGIAEWEQEDGMIGRLRCWIDCGTRLNSQVRS